MLNFKIRNEKTDDYEHILLLTYHAFLTMDYPGRRRIDEHFLIHLLQSAPAVIPELCFVAELDGEIVGHILYTKSSFKRADGTKINTITFGPLSILPKHQKRGIGKALIKHSMEKAKEMGFGAIIITGVPEYYPKVGFKPASEFNLSMPDFPIPEAFMAYELIEGYLAGGGIGMTWAPEYDIAETDDAGYEKFHKSFIKKYQINE